MSGTLEQTLTFALHHLEGTFGTGGPRRLSAYARRATDPLSELGQRMACAAAEVIGDEAARALGAAIEHLAHDRNVVVHGVHPHGEGGRIVKFPRLPKRAEWDQTMLVFEGGIDGIDLLTARAGQLAEQVADLGARAAFKP